MRHVVEELARIDTSILINNSSLSLSESISKFTNVKLICQFIFKVSITVLLTVMPLPFIVFVWGIHHSAAIFQILGPVSWIICICIIIVICAKTLFYIIQKQSVIDFSWSEDIHALATKAIVEPRAKINISRWILIDSLALSDVHSYHLTNISSAIGIISFLAIWNHF